VWVEDNPFVDLLIPMQLTVNQPYILFNILLIENIILICPSLLYGKDVDVMGYFFYFESFS
jgi:hypothetical protein